MSLKTIPLSLLFNLAILNCLAQNNIPLGTWRTHLSYNSANTLTLAEDKVYAGSPNGFFYFEKEYNSIVRETTITGFSDNALNKLEYSDVDKTLVLIYQNGNIDLLTDGKIFNIPTLKNAQTQGPKIIYHIFIRNSIAYLSCSFGLAILDLNKKEIKEVYQYIGINGQSPEIYSSTYHEGYLFLATSDGVMKGKLDPSINLQDFNNWKTYSSPEGLPSIPINFIASFNNTVYAGVNNTGIFQLQNNQWVSTSYPKGYIRQMQESQEKLIVCLDSSVLIISSNTFEEITNSTITKPYEAEKDSEGNIWIADGNKGLIRLSGQEVEILNPVGPYTNDIQRLIYANEKIIGLPGGYNSTSTPLGLNNGFYEFENGVWKNFNSTNVRPSIYIPPLKDLVSAAYDPQKSLMYVGSFQDGLISVSEDNNIIVYDKDNSPLLGTTLNPDQIRVSDLAFDFQGRLWVTNYGVPFSSPSVHVRKADGLWQSFPLNNSQSGSILQILIDNSDQKWFRIDPNSLGGGIIVFNDKTGKTKLLNDKKGQGGLHNTSINDFALDKTDAIWLATDNGIAIFYNTFNVIDNALDAVRPIFGNQYLLKDSKVNCIQIDEGNRKWIGTETGIWLFNDDASELILNFTTDNSPLLSNKIIDIEIHNKTGEVFIATDKGIISYRADATESTETFSSVKVFPNPIYPGYKGIVGISGLATNASIKITDISGKLIYQTKASGGTASWDLNGKKLTTGVYLVFSSSENGEEGLVSKIAVIE